MIRYQYCADGLDELIAAERARGRSAYVVAPATTKAQLLAAFADALSFPAYFGHNLDALAECLRHPDGIDRPATVVWSRAGVLRSRDVRLFTEVAQILEEELPDDVDAVICLR